MARPTVLTARGKAQPTRRAVANVLRPRKVVAFSLNGAARALLDVVSERTGESRSRVVERLILEGAWLLYGAGSTPREPDRSGPARDP